MGKNEKFVKTFYEYFFLCGNKKMLIQVCGFKKTKLKFKIATQHTYKRKSLLFSLAFFFASTFSHNIIMWSLRSHAKLC